METGFHALLPGRWVMHLHSLAALLMVYESVRDPVRFEAFWSAATPLRHSVLRAVRPGWLLMEQVRALPPSEVVLLENHGVILQAEDGEGGLGAWHAIERAFFAAYGYTQLLAWDGLTAEELARLIAPEAPLRLFFPDTAVFLDRLRDVLGPAGTRGGEALFQLAPHAFADLAGRERDVGEIWLSQLLLLSARPELSELPDSIASTVASLPVEQFRRAIHGGTP